MYKRLPVAEERLFGLTTFMCRCCPWFVVTQLTESLCKTWTDAEGPAGVPDRCLQTPASQARLSAFHRFRGDTWAGLPQVKCP